uniref:Uncharacterized protein n=1 Tax=Oryza sativa subsp. japonica TaxID=39947 RepID=Q2QVA1_ORYSJ|nr:hypothetical protein LOC_Os12g13520 [Oryza sativa Japonica Group]
MVDSVHRSTGARAHHVEDHVAATTARRGEVAKAWRRGGATWDTSAGRRQSHVDDPDRPEGDRAATASGNGKTRRPTGRGATASSPEVAGDDHRRDGTRERQRREAEEGDGELTKRTRHEGGAGERPTTRKGDGVSSGRHGYGGPMAVRERGVADDNWKSLRRTKGGLEEGEDGHGEGQ